MANREQSAEEVFGAALDLPPEERSAYLIKACKGSPEMRRLVEGLLADYRRLGNFLDDPLIPADGAVPSSISTSRILVAGEKLGRYTVIEPLGAGGMGAVYRARDERLERVVAVKILSPGVLTNEDSRRRFRKEALALAKLSHAHIAGVYDVGEQDGVDYLVMECVPGETLAAKLKAGPLTVKDATSITLQIAQALEDAHEQGVIHRDLKPANVMITPKGQVKVLDFGIAKLLAVSGPDVTATLMETGLVVGTPLYMSPEQAQGKSVDTRTDLWSLGVIYYESLAGCAPFRADGSLAVLHAIVNEAPKPVRELRPDVPVLTEQIVSRSLEKDVAKRYQSAAEMVADTSTVLAGMSTTSLMAVEKTRSRAFAVAVMATIVLALTVGIGGWFYHRSLKRQWAREEAIPQIRSLLANKKQVAAFLLLDKARGYLPSEPQFQQIVDENSRTVSITSSPSGATVEMQDYSTPDGPWKRVGVTPINQVQIPKGYFRWKASKAGVGELIEAPTTESTMDFPLEASVKAPEGMVFAPGGDWENSIGFIGWVGPYKLPQYYIDRYEVTNRDYQKFVDSDGYNKQQYWTEKFVEDGHELSWSEAMTKFRDSTDRPGPSTWVGGHYPEGQADYPVSGVSWFEASAYAAYVGKKLPILAQWFQAAPSDVAGYTVQASNFSLKAVAPVGTYPGVGPYGTYDMAGNVREWAANPVDGGSRFILGGSWKSPTYLYFDPEALSPFDRSGTNGFRCVRNLGPIPDKAAESIRPATKDFAHFKPASDSVFHAYEALYAYPKIPLSAKTEGIVKETVDWRIEKVSFDTAYRGERMSAYLFLPKKVQPPYQTVLFSPSARVLFTHDNKNGRELGDIRFFDYIVQSGRAVMYPIYEDTYERQVKFARPGGSQDIELTEDRYKDAARSLDYLATRKDIDNSRLAYLGVSMGSAEGVIYTALLQRRLKTSIFLDGGYFLDAAPTGADQADFAPRIKIPVLMVNGRYDFTFSVEAAQNPLFKMLGTRAEDKQHVILETPHDVTEDKPKLVKTVLDWLDHYLGRVNEKPI
jgi:serine/threonine protein kinase/formylglycine-generating enzyme required for sulfatase activity/dienelactone hydrolase